MSADVDAVIAAFALKPHPEGGFYRETFRAASEVDTPHGRRSASTAIYYLLPAGGLSALHRVRADEGWHFYGGEPLTLHLLDDEGARTHRLGPEAPQLIVPAGTWQAAVGPERGYTLCGCTVAPGFDFADFELPTREALLALFPAHAALVTRLTYSAGS
jgi:predicted cupin superfamily sugar epimerase